MNDIHQSKIDAVDFSNLAFGKVFTDSMVIVRYADKKWGPAALVPYGPLEMLPSISALHYGQAVFEGMKVFKSEDSTALIFRPDAHIQRFNRSLARLDMPELSQEIFMDALKMLIVKDAEWLRRAGQLYLRPFAFATSPYLGVSSSQEYIFAVIACPVGPYYTKPLKLKVETEYSRSAPGGVGFAKAAGNYAASLLPTKLAQQEGFDQLIWTDAATHTRIEESGTMNIFCVIDGKLITPALSNTILAGINRDSVLVLAREKGISVEERDVTVSELVSSIEKGKATELFGVGTAATIVSAESVTHEGKKYSLPKPAAASLSSFFYETLSDIKTGKAKDTHGWTLKISI